MKSFNIAPNVKGKRIRTDHFFGDMKAFYLLVLSTLFQLFTYLVFIHFWTDIYRSDVLLIKLICYISWQSKDGYCYNLLSVFRSKLWQVAMYSMLITLLGIIAMMTFTWAHVVCNLQCDFLKISAAYSMPPPLPRMKSWYIQVHKHCLIFSA